MNFCGTLRPNCDILICCSYNLEGELHSLSGHLFEILDYYYILKSHFNVKCLIPEVLNKDNFFEIISNHYSKEIIKDFNIEDFYFEKPHTIINKKILLVDGNYNFINKEYKITIIGKIYAFACGFTYFYPELKKNCVLLGDKKVYSDEKYQIDIDYTKKVLPYLNHIPQNREFGYITKNVREYDPTEIVEKYPNIIIYSNYLKGKNFTNKIINNWSFSKYIYTPIKRQFDCSPRLVIECRILNIPIEFWKIDYEDPGLNRRINSNLDDFILKKDDEIIKILKD